MGLAAMVSTMLAARLTADGEPVTLVHTAGAAFDPATRTSTPSSVTVGVQGLVWGVSAREANGGSILAADRWVRVAAAGLDFVPAPNDTLRIAGVSYLTVSVKTLRSGGVDISHLLQVRK